MVMNIPFTVPAVGDAEIEAMTRTLRSSWLSPGPRVDEFEDMISSFCDVKNAVCLNSCTAAIELALRALDVGPGDEVILPAYTFSATAAAVIHAGAVPVMVDSAPDGFLMDCDAMARAVGPKVKAVLPVDIGGVICDYDNIRSISETLSTVFRPSSPLQEQRGRIGIAADSAHGFGGERNGRVSGALADFTCFSFHSVKNITTADGGAVVWSDEEDSVRPLLKRNLKTLACHGQTKNSYAKKNSSDVGYDIEEIGFKYNMTDVAATLGVSQLKRIDGILQRRREIIRYYDERLAGLPVRTLSHEGPSHRSAAHLYMTLLDENLAPRRDEIIMKMMERGVQCNIHFRPLPLMTAYRRLGYSPDCCPNAVNSYLREITLPLYPSLSDAETEYVADCFCGIVRGVK